MTTRWAVAGTGSMAKVFLEDFAHVPDAEVVAIGSRSSERAREFAARHGIAEGFAYADLMAADVDVVYIATPHPQHRDLALAAIAAGKAVLVEKAFTATLAGAREVVDAARSAGVFCMEGMWTRFQPAVARARELVAAGAIGEVIGVQVDFGAFRAYDTSDRLFDPALGGGAILDLGVYAVSFAQHFLGTPERVVATGTRYPNGTDASAAIALQYADGRAASLWCSFTAETPGRALVMGTAGSIEVEPRFHHPTRLVVRRNGHETEVLDLPATGRGFTHEIEDVQRCLAAGSVESPLMPLDDTLVVMGVLEETLAQLGITMAEGSVDV